MVEQFWQFLTDKGYDVKLEYNNWHRKNVYVIYKDGVKVRCGITLSPDDITEEALNEKTNGIRFGYEIKNMISFEIDLYERGLTLTQALDDRSYEIDAEYF